MSFMKLNLGCGSQVPEGWLNVDYALGARLAGIPFFRALNRKFRLFELNWDKRIYVHDLSRKFPWADAAVDVVYSSHTLEHFTRDDGRRFIAECHRVLRKGGILRIVIPDLRHIVAEYFDGRIRADDFLEKLGIVCGNKKNVLKNRLAPFIQFPHKCMYDNPRLLEILNEAGFQAASRAAFDSDIDDIRLVESEERTENAVIVEGRKR
jgi:SAM-dependent methyltransferase